MSVLVIHLPGQPRHHWYIHHPSFLGCIFTELCPQIWWFSDPWLPFDSGLLPGPHPASDVKSRDLMPCWRTRWCFHRPPRLQHISGPPLCTGAVLGVLGPQCHHCRLVPIWACLCMFFTTMIRKDKHLWLCAWTVLHCTSAQLGSGSEYCIGQSSLGLFYMAFVHLLVFFFPLRLPQRLLWF